MLRGRVLPGGGGRGGARWTFVYLGAEVWGNTDGALWSWETQGLDGRLLAEWRPAWSPDAGGLGGRYLAPPGLVRRLAS